MSEPNSSKLTHNICFCLLQHNEQAKQALKAKFPDVIFKAEPLFELRKQGIIQLFRGFRSCDRAVFFTYDLQVQRALLLYSLVILWFSRKAAYFMDMQGKVERVNYGSLLFHYLPSSLADIFSIPCLLRRVKAQLRYLSRQGVPLHEKRDVMGKAGRVAYLRTDLWFGTKAGGSVGHIAGVVNGFTGTGAEVFIISTDSLELIDSKKTPLYIVKPEARFNLFAEVPELYHNEALFKKARSIFKQEWPDLIYQRYSLNNFTGVALAREFKLPFVLEYNGSEVWVARNWGRRLRFEKLANRIEMLNFQAADLVTVVSKPMRDELVNRGIPPDKIIVNPNGVDPQRYSSDIDGSSVRQQYKLDGKVVVGFIGTFGNWHGAEVLAKAAVMLIKELGAPPNTHFLFIGDGVRLLKTRQIIWEGHIEDRVTFTGLVPQHLGPEYLAACDILVAPHVPNPDGSPFFGSPTKLFEYMAMGKGIVASNLDQIGEVLEHGRIAWLVEPGNAASLANGILTLVKDEDLRTTLGTNARKEVMAKYTWTQHVSRTVARLREILQG
jgi:glycosyltransferase involved in cell wall biosynthesis